MRWGICETCKREKLIWRHKKNQKLLCSTCRYHDTSLHEECSKCGKAKSVGARTGSGEAICRNCYKKDPKTFKRCSLCGNKRRVEKLDSQGKPICGSCSRQVAICKKCGEKKEIQALSLCHKCYHIQHVAKKLARVSQQAVISG